MKIDRQDIISVLNCYQFDFAGGEKAQNDLVDKISHIYESAKTLLKMPKKLISAFDEVANYTLDKKVAKNIAYDILCQTKLSELLEELQSTEILKDKVSVDRKEYSIVLHVHDSFIVRTDLADGNTYINDKFYYDIEEQDLLKCYSEFITDNRIYVLYKKRRLLSFFGLSTPYLKTISDIDKIPKLKEKKSVYMIFTDKELIYKGN